MEKRQKNLPGKTPADSDMVLKKHVGLIHCENKLTLIQRKICNILLFKALDKIHDQDIFEISLRQLCSLVGYNSHDSKLIKESIKSLMSVVMEWNLLEDNKYLNIEECTEDMITWNASSLLAGASIKKGIIRYSYSPQMKSVLSSLDIYGRINLFVQAKFKSTYSLVLYENCVRFKNIKQTSWFPIKLFRSLMGVPEEKYSSFKEFKRNVINVGVREVNQKSDIHVEPKFKKAGRNIEAVQFVVDENEKYKPSFKRLTAPDNNLPDLQQETTLLNLLISDFSLTEAQAKHIISEYPIQYVMEKINLVRSKKKIDHPGAYLLAAIKQDYKNSANRQSVIKSRGEDSSPLRETKQAYDILPLKNKYMAYKIKIYTDFIHQQAEKVQVIIKETFEQFIKPKGEVFRLYKKSGYHSPFVMTDFFEFIDNHFPQIIGEYLSFEDYISSDEN